MAAMRLPPTRATGPTDTVLLEHKQPRLFDALFRLGRAVLILGAAYGGVACVNLGVALLGGVGLLSGAAGVMLAAVLAWGLKSPPT